MCILGCIHGDKKLYLRSGVETTHQLPIIYNIQLDFMSENFVVHEM